MLPRAKDRFQTARASRREGLVLDGAGQGGGAVLGAGWRPARPSSGHTPLSRAWTSTWTVRRDSWQCARRRAAWSGVGASGTGLVVTDALIWPHVFVCLSLYLALPRSTSLYRWLLS